MGEVSLTSTFSTHTELAHQQESCEQETTAEGIPTKSQPLQSSGLSVTARAALHTPFPVCVWRSCSPSHCGEISPRESTDSLQTRPRLKEFLVHNSRQNRVGKQLNPNAEKQWFNRRGSPRQCPAQHSPALPKPVQGQSDTAHCGNAPLEQGALQNSQLCRFLS